MAVSEGAQERHYLERILNNLLPNTNGTGASYANEGPTGGDQAEFPKV